MNLFTNKAEHDRYLNMSPMDKAAFMREKAGERACEGIDREQRWSNGTRTVVMRITWKDYGYLITEDGCRIGDGNLFWTLQAAREAWRYEVDGLKAIGYVKVSETNLELQRAMAGELRGDMSQWTM